VPLREYDLPSLRARISVVYQDFARFALTLRENVAVGAVAESGAEGDDARERNGRLEQAARWAGADGDAARLPRGYDTELTRRFAGGVDLSGGEWQKVALARGAIRDAALVILDEPTAALDAEAEYQLFERFRELVAGKTALLISHRFSTVRMADHILVLEGGRILASGSHDALVALGGRYASLFEMQAGRYR
jgi:ATP-binding cassette subfamily B protein